MPGRTQFLDQTHWPLWPWRPGSGRSARRTIRQSRTCCARAAKRRQGAPATGLSRHSHKAAKPPETRKMTAPKPQPPVIHGKARPVRGEKARAAIGPPRPEMQHADAQKLAVQQIAQMPTTPATTEATARIPSGYVITRGDSCAWAGRSDLAFPQKTTKTRRNM